MTWKFRPIRRFLSFLSLRRRLRSDAAVAAEIQRLRDEHLRKLGETVDEYEAKIQRLVDEHDAEADTLSNENSRLTFEVRRLTENEVLATDAAKQRELVIRRLQAQLEWETATFVRREQKERMQPVTPQELIDQIQQ